MTAAVHITVYQKRHVSGFIDLQNLIAVVFIARPQIVVVLVPERMQPRQAIVSTVVYIKPSSLYKGKYISAIAFFHDDIFICNSKL